MKVLLIDDHPLVLSALTDIIHKLDAQSEVCTADDPRRIFEFLEDDADFNLVLLDPLLTGGGHGDALLTDLRRRYPALPVVVMGATDGLSDMVRAIDLGAMAFLPKRTPIDELHAALALVLSGGIYIPQAQRGRMQMHTPAAQAGNGAPTSLQNGLAHAPLPDAAPRPSVAALGLTPRQTDVLRLLLKGLPNKLIARELNVSVDTVKDHVAAVLRALGVTSRTQAVLVLSGMTRAPGGH